MVVVSGADEATVENLLLAAESAIEPGKPAMVLNSRGTIGFPQRYFTSPAAQYVMTPISDEAARLRELDVLLADGAIVLLVANQFDRGDPIQNPHPRNVIIDTCLDVFRREQVQDIPFSNHRAWVPTREIFPYITKLFYYDTSAGTIEFIKDQIPTRP